MAKSRDDDVEIDAEIVAEGFGLDPRTVQDRIREGAITSRVYRGEGEDAGTRQLVFFHGSVRLTLIVDDEGRLIRRSRVDFGDRPMPRGMHKP